MTESDLIADVLLAAERRLSGVAYVDRGGIPYVERELVFAAINETAKELIGDRWYVALGDAVERCRSRGAT